MLPLTLNFAARPDENARAVALLSRRGWLIYFAGLVGVVIVIGLAWTLARDLPLVSKLNATLLAGLSSALLVLFAIRPFARWLGVRFLGGSSPAAAITLSDAGITVEMDGTRTELQWHAFQGLLIGRDIIVLQTHPRAGLFLVRRALPEPDLWARFCEEVGLKLAIDQRRDASNNAIG